MMSWVMDRPPFAQALLPSGLGHDWVLECIGSVLDLAKFDQMATGVYASPDTGQLSASGDGQDAAVAAIAQAVRVSG